MPFVPSPEVPEVPDVPLVPVVIALPLTTYKVLGSLVPNAAYDADDIVTICCATATSVNESVKLSTQLPELLPLNK